LIINNSLIQLLLQLLIRAVYKSLVYVNIFRKKLNTTHMRYRIKCEKTVSLNQQERVDRYHNIYQ